MKTNRRNFFQTLGAGATGFGLASTIPLASCATNSENTANDDGQALFIGDNIAIAETVYGKVRGFIHKDIFQFRGIPYGADTSGENRFMPPQKPEPWTDVYPALWWGDSAPQAMEGRYSNPISSFIDHWNYGDLSEDCLTLNVWTPALDDKKRPVMVWFHGGGFRNGNAIEQDGYKGENLSRYGDIVFVSVNHRLGPFGFTDLSSVSGKYAHSGNAGSLDMVAALEWVKENISNFGGDAGNVTIMGQSGGGAKVCTLAAMPKAKGLIHKVVPLSGSSTMAGDQSYTQKLGEFIVKEAGLNPSEINKLQEMPWKDYLELANNAARKFAEEMSPGEGRRGGFSPVADGVNVPKETFFSDPNGVSSDVPMLICSTFHEHPISRANAELEELTKEEVIARITESSGGFRGRPLGDKATEVYEAYERSFSDAKPVEIAIMIASNRKGVVRTANAKKNQQAPVYVAWFGWQPPLFDNRMRAFHCSDICFWYYNTDLMLTHTGGGARPRKLSEKMSNTLLNFMRTGNPNGGGLPEWPEYTVENGETMVLNDVSEVKNDPDKEGREML